MSTGVGKVPILAIKVLNPLPLLSSHQEDIFAYKCVHDKSTSGLPLRDLDF